MGEILPALLAGTFQTVVISVLASTLALVLAFFAALARISAWRTSRILSAIYIEFFRGTSLIVQLFWLFFVLPQFGVSLAPLTVAVLGIALNYGAYGAEVIRGAILGVPSGQREAAEAIGLSKVQTMLLVVLPQAAIIAIPSWGNLLIQLIKATSITSLITISELTFRAYQLNQLTFRTGQIFGVVLVIYYLLSSLVVFGTRSLERWAKRGQLGETT